MTRVEEIFPSLTFILSENITEKCAFVQGIDVLDEFGRPVYNNSLQTACLVIAIICIIGSTLLLSLVYYDNYYRKNFKDELLYLTFVYAGILIVYYLSLIRIYIGRVNHPNDVYFFLIHLSTIVIALPTVTITQQQWYKIRLFYELRKITFNDSGASQSGLSNDSSRGTSLGTERFSYIPQDLEELDNKKEAVDKAVAKYQKQRLHLLRASIPVMIISYVFTLVIMFATDSDGKFFTGCFGVHDSYVNPLIHVSIQVACGIWFFVSLMMARKDKQVIPITFKIQLPYLTAGATGTIIASIIYVFARSETAYVSGHIVLALALFIGYFGITGEIYLAHHLSRKKTNQHEKDYDLFLHNPIARSFFEMHLVSEMSLENLLFYTEAREWTKEFGKTKDHALYAQYIYYTYLDDSSELQINLNNQVAKRIKRYIHSIKAEEEIPQNLFEDAMFGIKRDMIHDSFPRFFRSKLYKQFLDAGFNI